MPTGHPGQPGYFDINHYAEEYLYVGWFDIMGTQNNMRISLPKISNFIFKMYSYVKDCNRYGLNIYPLMDGFYATHSDKTEFFKFVNYFFSKVFSDFARESKNKHKFMIRGAVAYGPVVIGKNMEQSYHFKDDLIIGIPVTQAYRGESLAPPFGIYLDESVRAFPSPQMAIPRVFYKWQDMNNRDNNVTDKYEIISQHLDWCKTVSKHILYSEDRIEEHRKLAEQYFTHDDI